MAEPEEVAYKEGSFDFSDVQDRDILKLVETIFNISFQCYSEEVVNILELKFDVKFNQTGMYPPKKAGKNEQD